MINVRCNGVVIDNPVSRLWLRTVQRTFGIVFDNQDIVYCSIRKDTCVCMDEKSPINSPESFTDGFSLLVYALNSPVYFYQYGLVVRRYAFKH